MTLITVQDRQTVIDAHLIACGTLDGIIDTCALSDISLTDDVSADSVLPVDDSAAIPRIVATYALRGYSPATAIVAGSVRFFGIGYMAIGVDFMVR